MEVGLQDELSTPNLTLLRFLSSAARPLTAQEVAELLWPDSPAWRKRTRRHDGRAGAVGGTMPMRAGAMLRRLRDQGLVTRPDSYTWTVTAAGARCAATPTRTDPSP